MPASFPKRNRLLNSRDYQSVFKQPRKFFSESFLVLVTLNKLPYSRMGLVLKRKHIKRAVKRNTFKRVIRESFRTHPEIVSAGFDLVVIVHKALHKKNLAEKLDQQWKSILTYYRKS